MTRRSGLPDQTLFEPYLKLWALTPDGPEIETHSSRLLPVKGGNKPLMLKVAIAHEEQHGNRLLVNWSDGPYVDVLDHSGDAVLMVRADGVPSLTEMSKTDDAQATRILCDVGADIHKSSPPWGLIPLERRFRDLFDTPTDHRFEQGKAVAKALLAEPQHVNPLHGDLHHGNVLYFKDKGWRAIDPKGVIGECGFDFANIFCNPTVEIALRDGRLEEHLAVVSKATGISAKRLTKWIIAWTALSAVWSIESGDDPRPAFKIGEKAALSLRE